MTAAVHIYLNQNQHRNQELNKNEPRFSINLSFAMEKVINNVSNNHKVDVDN